MNRAQRELADSANRIDALIVKVAVVLLVGIAVLQLFGA